MEELLNTLKAEYGDDVALREGSRSFARGYSERDLRPGGFYADAFALGREDVTVAKTTVGKSGAFIVAFMAAGKTWEALVGLAKVTARDAKVDADVAAEAEARAAEKAEADAALASRKSRSEPAVFRRAASSRNRSLRCGRTTRLQA